MFNAQPSWIGVVRAGDKVNLVLSRASIDRTLADLPTGLDRIVVQTRVNAEGAVTYSYSLDGAKTFTMAEPACRLAFYGWWKGARPGRSPSIRSAEQARLTLTGSRSSPAAKRRGPCHPKRG
ncbi:hypothetical protein HNO88_002531 [Novosphingobium chloroacetimidivorans]|uniref:Uncharacterized protein n=2 Tax=Novosphingobium chloroacetimidivorans TaxID=1428314 RepID=A0A7W7KAF6_9SPHN|nr:hypothetical protein [Novosphingobium chloroacetimidivorans]